MDVFKEFVEKHNLPKFRLSQIEREYYDNCIESWDNITTLPKDVKALLIHEIPIFSLTNYHSLLSSDKTTEKVLAYTIDGYPLEAVLMKHKNRYTVCVSCMSGCPVGCRFCSTGTMGFGRNLETREIIDQIMYFRRKLHKENKEITNIVFMGMGEPMLNLDNLIPALDIIQNKIGMSPRRITVSTSGYVEPLKKFLAMRTGVKIAISLHAPNQKIRERIMPSVAKISPLPTLMDVLLKYQKETNKKITYEYVLLDGINDFVDNAKELAKLLQGQLCLVNLINYNDGSIKQFKRSEPQNLAAFEKTLIENGINYTLRHSQGNDIMAACGQLAAKQNRGDLT